VSPECVERAHYDDAGGDAESAYLTMVKKGEGELQVNIHVCESAQRQTKTPHTLHSPFGGEGKGEGELQVKQQNDADG